MEKIPICTFRKEDKTTHLLLWFFNYNIIVCGLAYFNKSLPTRKV